MPCDERQSHVNRMQANVCTKQRSFLGRAPRTRLAPRRAASRRGEVTEMSVSICCQSSTMLGLTRRNGCALTFMSSIFGNKSVNHSLMGLLCSPFASPSCSFCANGDDEPHPMFSLALTSDAQQDFPDAQTPAAPPPPGQRVP